MAAMNDPLAAPAAATHERYVPGTGQQRRHTIVVLVNDRPEVLQTESKTSLVDIVTDMDRRSEAAIREVLGDVPVTAPKSYFGHSGAGSGAVARQRVNCNGASETVTRPRASATMARGPTGNKAGVAKSNCSVAPGGWLDGTCAASVAERELLNTARYSTSSLRSMREKAKSADSPVRRVIMAPRLSAGCVLRNATKSWKAR